LLLEQLSDPNSEALPTISIRTANELGGAFGAFASSTNTIYLSDSFLSNNLENIEAITDVLLEEIGHSIDAQLNVEDTIGDEGELFSNLVRGIDLSEPEFQRINTEDDSSVVIIDGQTLSVEQALKIPISGQVSVENPVGIDINSDGLIVLPPPRLSFFYISTIPSTQENITSSFPGVNFINLNTGNTIPIVDFTQLDIDTSSVFDVVTGQFRNFGNTIFPQSTSYGDIAVLERGNRLDIVLAGGRFNPFILRLRWENRTFQGARIMAASVGSTAGNINLTRGVAVNSDGTVLTTLPVNISNTDLIPQGYEHLFGGFYDVPVAFNIDYPETGNFLPQFMRIDSSTSNDNRLGFTDIASQGMDSDQDGNFYVVTNSTGSTALGMTGEGNLIVIDKNLTQVVSVGTYNEFNTSFRDVAVDANGDNAYVTVDRSSVFGFGVQADRIVGFDLTETKSILNSL
jgi:hypothetical protein